MGDTNFDWANGLDFLFLPFIGGADYEHEFTNYDIENPVDRQKIVEQLYNQYESSFDGYQQEELRNELSYLITNESTALKMLDSYLLPFKYPQDIVGFLIEIQTTIQSKEVKEKGLGKYADLSLITYGLTGIEAISDEEIIQNRTH